MRHLVRVFLGVTLLLAMFTAPAAGDSGARTYDYHVCDAFLDEAVGFDSRCVARASNGDVIELEGTGELAIHPKSANGGGVFEHRRPDGTAVGSGQWTATRLLSFTSYGPADPESGLPPELEGGQALLEVVLIPAGAPPGTAFEAILEVQCLLPGAQNPGGASEGAELTVKGGPNFNEKVVNDEMQPATVFVRTS